MKRGNTALKRGVGLASAFALAIAGAVIAAPAASASPANWMDGDNIRATPVADAAWVDAAGALRTSADIGAAYNSTHATGQAVWLSGTNQLANGFQFVMESDNGGGGNWSDGEVVTVTLANATFNSTPSVSISPLSRISGPGSIEYVAGVSGEHATLPTAVSAADSTLGLTTGPTVATNVLTLKFKADPDKATAATGQGYVVTVSGVKVNVDSAAAQGAPITATLGSTATGVFSGTTAGGDTTLGFASNVSLKAADGAIDAGATAPQTVPVVTLAETTKNGFGAGVKTLNVTDNGGTPATVFAAVPTAAVSGSTTLTATPSSFAANNDGVVTLATPDNNAVESVTLTGIKVNAIPADATKVTISLASSGGTASNGSNGFSFYPSASALSVDVPISRPDRYAGANRYETAAKIAGAMVPGADASSFVLANGTDVKDGADALSANFLKLPILLTDASSMLPKATSDAIKAITKSRTGTVEIFVLGKTDSVSQAARNEAAVAAAAATGVTKVTVTELAGNNRNATSAAVAAKGSIGAYALKAGEPYLKTAFLASGTTNADALAAGAASANLQIPVLLTNGPALDDAVAKAVDDLGIQQLIVLGGTDRVSEDAITQAKAKGVTSVYRIAGADRYATAAAIYTFIGADPTKGPGLGKSFDAKAFLASGGAGWPDALAVGPLAGSSSNVAPVLTTGADKLASAAETFLKDNKATVKNIWAVGGTDRVSADVLKAAQALSK